MAWNLDSECSALKVGNHMKLGDIYESEIVEMSGQQLKLKQEITLPETEDAAENNTKMKVAVKRTNFSF